MLKTLVFVDFSNLVHSFKEVCRKPDLIKLKSFLAPLEEGRFCIDMHVYASLPHDQQGRTHSFHEYLRMQGLMVHSRRAKKLPDGKIKANLDDLLILDAIEMGLIIKPDIVVLVTGDGGFSELAVRLRRNGIRVEVASLESSLANELKRAVNGIIDLAAYANQCEGLNGAQAIQLGSEHIFDSEIAF